MIRPVGNTPPSQPSAAAQPSLGALLSQSGDEFYGSLQGTLNELRQAEEQETKTQEHDAFVYAHPFARTAPKRIYIQRERRAETVQTA